MTRKALRKAEYEMLAAFRHSLREFLRFSEEAARSVGLTPQQHQALLALRGIPSREKATIGALADRLGLKHHSVVGLVDRLATAGLVSRQSARADRREVYVRLTPRGVGLLGRLAQSHREELVRRAPELRRLLDRLSRKH